MHPYHHVVSEDGAESLTVFLPDGAPVVATGDHPHFADLIDYAREGAAPEDIRELADLSAAVAARLEPLSERVAVGGGRVYFDGDEVHGAIVGHILRGLDAGLSDWRPYVRFMENVAANPNEHSREQLFDWLAARDFSITEDGHFIGYKGVAVQDGTFVSVFAGPAIVDGEPVNGHVPNRVGSTVEIARSRVLHDPGVGCASGLHVGTFDYAQGWARGGLLRVKVNPRDVVSVPTDSGHAKVRVCRYHVLEVIDRPDTLPVYFDDADHDADGEFDLEICEVCGEEYPADGAALCDPCSDEAFA